MSSKSLIHLGLTALIFGAIVIICHADDTTPDPFCPYPGDEITFYPYPGDCNKYIECYAGNKYYMQCGKDLYWNDYAKTCDYTCYTSESPDDGSSTTPHGSLDPSCPSSGTHYYPHYSNCQKFFQCKDGYKITLHCTDGFAFNSEINTCDLRENVDCSYTTSASDVTTARTTTDVPRTTIDWQTCPSSGISYLPNYANCSKFYECNEGEKIELSCQEDQAWSVNSESCEDKANVDCSYTTLSPGGDTTTTSTTTTTKTTTTTTHAPDDNDCPSQGLSYLPHRYDCTKFYECLDGVKSELACQEGYAWSIVLNTCANKNEVDCSYTSVSPGETTVTPKTTTTANPNNRCSDKADGTLLPHPTDDSKYIECANGKEVIMDCAKGTTFDPDLGLCD